jgi:hypothetical protein
MSAEQERFLDELARELRARGVPVLRSELRAFVHDAWPLIAEDPAVSRWATAWQQAHPWEPAGSRS